MPEQMEHASEQTEPCPEAPPELASLTGEAVVLDMASRYVFLGTLVAVRPSFLLLGDADAHDLRDTSTTRDSYVLDARQHGISVSRREVWVRLEQVVGVSRLSDVIV